MTSSSASTGPPASAGRCRSATCPTCSATSPRCRSSSPSSASTRPSCGGACPRPSTRPPSGGRPPTAAGCGPPTSPPATATARSCPATPRSSIAQIDGWCREQGDRAGDPVLWMNGTDHLLPQAHLGRVVAEANDLQDDYRLEVTSLAAPRRGRVPDRRSSCRSGRASCAPGPGPTCSWAWRPTGSTCTRPRCAPPAPSSRSPSRSRRSTSRPTAGRPASSTRPGSRSSATRAHDSICACSVDEVGRAVIHRFDEARTIAEGLIDRAVAAIADAAGGDAPIAVNPAARPRSGLVELTDPGRRAARRHPGGVGAPGPPPAHLGGPPGRRARWSPPRSPPSRGYEGVVVEERDGVLVVEIYIDRTTPPAGAFVERDEAVQTLQQLIAADPDGHGPSRDHHPAPPPGARPRRRRARLRLGPLPGRAARRRPGHLGRFDRPGQRPGRGGRRRHRRHLVARRAGRATAGWSTTATSATPTTTTRRPPTRWSTGPTR